MHDSHHCVAPIDKGVGGKPASRAEEVVSCEVCGGRRRELYTDPAGSGLDSDGDGRKVAAKGCLVEIKEEIGGEEFEEVLENECAGAGIVAVGLGRAVGWRVGPTDSSRVEEEVGGVAEAVEAEGCWDRVPDVGGERCCLGALQLAQVIDEQQLDGANHVGD